MHLLRAAHDRFRFAWLVAVLLGIAMARELPSTQAPRLDIPGAVSDAIAADGAARVIVGVRARFVPEGFLGDRTSVADQRASMHRVVEDVMGRAAAVGALLGRRFETIPFFTAQVDGTALAALAARPDVFSIELDAPDRPLLAQSAPLVSAPAAWSAGHTGAGWSVVVLDTGVEKTHSFFGGRVTAEACFSNAGGAGTGTSLCPGGVPSSTAIGSGVNCSASVDGCFHGTHVAGIAAGATGGGINGIAPGANIIAMQVFTRFEAGSTTCGTTSTAPCVVSFSSDQILALERTLALAGPGNANRIAAVNMSLGGLPVGSVCDANEPARKAAIDNLLSIGIATVIATGNDGSTTGVSAPACISTAVAVGSTTKGDLMSSFTNRRAGMVDLLAPGSAITASILGNAFGTASGTSMATPHVAGAWAVLKQAAPAAGVAQVLAALQNTGQVITDAGSGSSYRRINVNAARLALLNPGALPGAPAVPTISGGGNTVTIAWAAPTTGGAATSYTVIARLAPGGQILTTLPVGNALTTTVPGVPNGTFHVSVMASNASGSGPESPGITFNVPLAAAPPGAPTGLSVSVTGDRATFGWTPPAAGGTATGYLLVAAATAGGAPIATLPFPAPANGVVVSNIPPGTYFVRLAATNAGGTSPLSNEVVVSVPLPQPPGPPALHPPVVSGDGQVTLAWSAPTAGGAAASYMVAASLTSGGPVIATVPVAGLGVTVPAPRGTYFVRVFGINAVGTGTPSNEITVVVP